MSDTAQTEASPLKWVVWLLAVVLLVIHQDFWWWDDASLIAGILPVGLAFHAFFSIAAAITWGLAIKFAWPHHLERLAEDEPAAEASASEGNAS